MKSPQIILLSLLVFLSFSIIKAQKPQTSPTSAPVADEDTGCVLPERELVRLDVSVINSKGFNIKNLTYKDFEVYERKERYEIEFFKFDESKNQYLIGFTRDDSAKDNKQKKLNIKVNLSEEKKKQHGKVFIKVKTVKFE